MNTSFFAVIPAPVLYSKSLKANSKLIYGIISSLTSKEGYCYASNNYLSDQIGLTACGVSRLITDLKSHNFIKVKTIREGKVIKQRRIYLTNAVGVVTNDQGGSDKSARGVVTKAQRDNNNSINKEDIIPSSFFEEIKELYNNTLGQTLPKVIALNNQRKRALSKMIKFHEKHRLLDWWSEYFELVSGVDFLMGRTDYDDSHKNWRCDFDFVINFDKFIKIIEGKYL